MRVVKLKTLCSIQMGYSFRSRLSKEVDGHLLIQLKDIENDSSINISNLNRITAEDLKPSHLVECGDVVFRSRGESFKVALVPEITETVILSAPLLRLRVELSEILPEYLCWYINQSKGQGYFDGVAAGSAIKMISKALLSELPVMLPSIDEQKTVVELIELQKHEVFLMHEIINKKEKLLKNCILQFIE